MVQVPAAIAETVLPVRVHTVGVELPKVTVRPEVADALAVVLPPTINVDGEKLINPMV